MGLSEFYQGLEDAYYNFMDGLENSGIKVYEWFINPVEDRGMPSMPVFFLAVLLVLAGVFYAALSLSGGEVTIPGFGGGSGVNVAVSVSGPDSARLDDVQVKLSSGDATRSAKTKNGVANFENVPYAKTMTVRIDQSGYKSFSKDFPVPSGRSSATFTVSLEAEGAAAGSMVLFVSDDNQYPLSNAEVRFQDPLTGEFVTQQTDAQGRVTLSVPTDAGAVTFSVSHDAYQTATQSCLASQSTCSVTLFSAGGAGGGGGLPTPNPSIDPEWATVRVEVLDTNGNGLAGKVTLYRDDTAETLDYAVTDGQGVARFDNVPLGIRIYATFDPDASGYSPHTFDSKLTVEATDFFVQLNPRPSPSPGGTDFSTVWVQAVDSKKQPISGASVRLYLSSATVRAVSDTVFTGDDGKVIFDIAPTARVYATVWAPGFLPAMTRVLTGGEGMQVVLQPVLVGNHGSLNVTVVDEAGIVVSGASVSLLTHDGFAIGMPSQDTGLDGVTVFEGLPLQRLKATAVYGAQVGSSDIVEIGLVPKSQRIVLQPATAFVSAKAFDAANKSAVSATFTAVLSSNNHVVGACTTNGTACSISIPANRNVVLYANASGYVALASEELSVEPGATQSKSMYLLPSALSNQLTVLSYAVEDDNGRNVTALDKGRIYSFTVSFNLPSTAQKSGVFLRVGTASEASQSPAVFGDYSKPSGVEVVKGARFNPGPTCSDDLGDQTGPIQWIDWSYSQFGAQTVKADVFVKPDAKIKDEVTLHFRLYAKAGEVFIRKPDDARYGGLEKTADLDSCYALTSVVKLPIIDGKSTCNDRACLSTRFASSNASAANGLRLDVDQAFNVSLDLRAFIPLDSPFLSIKTSPAVHLTGYDFGTLTPISPSANTINIPLSFFQRANGTLYAKARLPTQSALFDFTFSDTTGTILDASRFVVVQGTGQFNLAASTSPNTRGLEALQENTLTITVLSSNGVPVTNAKLSLKETQGAPFEGFPNGPETVVGDGTQDKGKDGVYKFKKIRPHAPGSIAVVAVRDGFQEAEIEVAVTAAEPLEFGQDITGIQLDCKNPTTLTVTSRVNAELKVAASFSGTACASMRVLSPTTGTSGTSSSSTTSSSTSSTSTVSSTSGSTTANFRVKPGKDTKVLLTPILDGDCVLSFNAETLSGQALGVSDAFLSSQCGLNPTPSPSVTVTLTPSVTPSPVPGADCAARGGQCVPLGQSCPSGFVPSTYQASGPTWPSGYSPYSGYGSNNPYGSSNPYGVTPTPVASVQPAAACSEGQQCCIPVSQVCQAPNFNFQNIFAKYLGYYLNVQLTSNYPQQVTAASAPVRLTATQNGVTVRDAGSCSASGNGLTCEKEIFALIPYNAMAFSVENQLFNSVEVLAKYDHACYNIKEVGRFSGVNEFFTDIKQSLQVQANLLTRQTRTFVIYFQPSEQCVEYTFESGTASLKLTEKGAKPFQVRLQTLGSGVYINAPAFDLQFNVKPTASDADALAFIAMPAGTDKTKVTLRGKDGAKYEEPAVFANNIQTKQSQIQVSGTALTNPVTIPGANARATTLQLVKGQNALTARLGASAKAQIPLSIEATVVPAPDGLQTFDIVGNVDSTDSGDLLACSGANYCHPDVATENLKRVKETLSTFAGQYMESVDTLSYEDPFGIHGGDNNAYQRLYQQAMQDALREYMALRSQYDACVRQGQDPLSGTRAYCQQYGSAPVYNYNQGAAGYYNQQGFAGGYAPGGYPGGANPAYAGGGYPNAGGGGQINPALGGGQVPGYPNPYTSNFYPGPGYSPGYVNDPSFQQNLGSAFGAGWNQAGCSSDILNAFQYQGALGMGYFSPFQQQMMQQQAYSRGVYSSRKPVISDLQPVIAFPVKEAGATGGIKVYQIKADLRSVSGDDGFERVDFVSAQGQGSLNPVYWQGYNYGPEASPSSRRPPGDSKPVEKYGYPYLKYNKDKNLYEIQNWVQSGSATGLDNSPPKAAAAPAIPPVKSGDEKTSPAPKVATPTGLCGKQSDSVCLGVKPLGICTGYQETDGTSCDPTTSRDEAGDFNCVCKGYPVA